MKPRYVLCGWKLGLDKFGIVKGVHLYRTGGSIIEVFRRNLQTGSANLNTKGIKQQKSEMGNDGRIRCRRLFGVAESVHDQTWKKVYWPDYACLWYFSAVSMARRLITTKGYDAMITVSLPFTSHLVGLS